MATLTIDTTNNLFAQSITITKKDNTQVTLNTENTFIDKDIKLTLGVKSGSATTPATTITTNPTISIDSTGKITASYSGSKSITPTISAGWVASGTAGTVSTNGSATKQLDTKAATTYNASTSNQTIAAGVYLTDAQTILGITTLNIDATNIKSGVNIRVGDTGSATRIKNVTGTFTAANTVSSGQTAADADKILQGYSAWVNATELKGTIPIQSSDSVTIAKNAITVPAGYYASNVETQIETTTPTTSYSNTGLSTYFTSQSNASGASVTITPQYTNSAGYIEAHTNTNNGGVGYWTIKTSSMSKGTTSVSGTTATRGIASWGTGWISNGSIAAATFANSGASGVSYVDISNTTAAPVLTSNGYLYINAGYTDNLRISLAKLIPDTANVTTSGQLLNGVTAYDKDGKLITGNIQTKTVDDLTVDGKTIIAPAGYYASNVSKSVADGAYSADSSTSSNSTVTPKVDINNASTYGFTTTKPSGTNGTNYLTIDPGASATAWSVTPRANITTTGYLETGSKTGTAITNTPSIAAGTNYYVPVRVPSFNGGTVSGSSTTSINITGMLISTDETAYYIDASSTGSASRTAVTYSNSSGVMAAHTNTQALAASGSTAINSSASRVYIPAASITISGSPNASKPTITRTSTTSNGATNVGTGTITTTAPTTGYFVSMQGTAPATTISLNKEFTAGYLATANQISASASTKATTGDIYYLQITKGVAAANSASVAKITTDGSNAGVNISGVVGTATTIEPTTGYYVAFTGSGSSKVTTAGWFPTGALAAATSATTYFPITTGSCTIAGGVLSTSGFSKTDLALTLADGEDSNMANITIGAKDTDNYAYYFKVNGSTPAVSGNTSASVTAITDKHTAGYIPAKAQTNFRNAQAASPAVSVNATSNNTYISLKAAGINYNGGGLSNTSNYTGTPSITLTTNSSTNMANYRLGTQDTTNYPYYFQIKATTAKMTGTTTVTRAAYTDTRTAGYLPARNATTVLASTTSSPSVTVEAATNTTYYFSMKKAAMKVAGTNTVTPNSSMAGTNATLSDTDNGIKIVATGGGTASVTATATTSTTGYAPASTQLGSATLSASNTTTTATKYISGVKLIPPSSGTRSFTITVPNGNTTDFIDFVFTVDKDGNVTVAGPD